MSARERKLTTGALVAKPTDMVKKRSARAGLTMVEVVVASSVLAGLAVGMLTIETMAQGSFRDQQILAELRDRGTSALYKMTRETGRTFTTSVAGTNLDASAATSELTTLWPTTNTDARGILFRETVGGNTSGPIFSSTIAFIGPHTEAVPTGVAAGGVVKLREVGLTSTSMSALGSVAGGDGLLGTFDDLQISAVDGLPRTERLIPAIFAPQTTPMFRVDLSGRVVTYTLRLNYRRSNGTWLLGTDIVLTERVTLVR